MAEGWDALQGWRSRGTGGYALPMTNSQLDLFSRGQPQGGRPAHSAFQEAPPELVERVRAELTATLARVQAAEALPWPDLTQTTLAELRFNSIAGWLPEDEGASLRAAFAAEMSRLYEAEDRRLDTD